MEAIGDIDGDGVPDLLVAAPRMSVGGCPRAGRVYALSGSALAEGRAQVIYVVDPPRPQAGQLFGFALGRLAGPGNGHSQRFAVGASPQPGEGPPDEGRVWIFDAATGKLVRELTNPLPPSAPIAGAQFGSRLASAGDLDGDGVSEILVGAAGNSPPGIADGPDPFRCGQAFIFNGASGELMRTLDLPEADREYGPAAWFGLSVHTPGDVDGDGLPDHLISAPGLDADTGRMYLFSGGTGDLLTTIDSPEPQAGAQFGFQQAAAFAPGDVDHDGNPEIYGNGFRHTGPAGKDQGRGWIFDASGAAMFALDDPHPRVGAQFGWSIAQTDFHADGSSDLFIGASPHHTAGPHQDGAAHIFSGKDGSVLQSFYVPAEYSQPGRTGNLGPAMGWSIAAPGDLDGDGRPDYIAGAPFTDVGDNQDEGMIFVFTQSPG